mgnify:CR=1 FL=1
MKHRLAPTITEATQNDSRSREYYANYFRLQDSNFQKFSNKLINDKLYTNSYMKPLYSLFIHLILNCSIMLQKYNNLISFCLTLNQYRCITFSF